MARELLEKVRSGAKQGSIQLKDVEEILSNRDFTSGEGLLVTTGPDNEVCGSIVNHKLVTISSPSLRTLCSTWQLQAMTAKSCH